MEPQEELAMFERIAEAAAASGLYRTAIPRASGGGYDELTPSAALMIVLRGKDLGLGPATALEQVKIYKGKLTLPAGTIAGLIQRSEKYSYRVIKHDDLECQLEFTFPTGQGLSVFDLDDARKAGLGGDMWTKYPRNMLFARALTNGARWYCAEVFGGAVYTPDELQDEKEPRAQKEDLAYNRASTFLKKPSGPEVADTIKAASQSSGEIQLPPATEGPFPLQTPISAEEWAALDSLSIESMRAWAIANQPRMVSEEQFKVKAMLVQKKAELKKAMQAINVKTVEEATI